MERDAEIRKGIRRIQKAIRESEANEAKFLEKAKRAKQLGDKQMLGLLFSNYNRARLMRATMERQLLAVETARQIKDQAETHAAFAMALGTIAKSVGSAYKEANPVKTAREFETAMDKAETLGEQMDVFLSHAADMAADVGPIDENEAENVVPREEFENMLEEEVVADEERDLDEAIDEDLADIEQKLGSGEDE
jgi:hypothetical protein